MDSQSFSVYFRGFPAEFDNEEVEGVFARCGNIKKFFIHKSRTYGMVEFEELRYCTKAIAELSNKPPLHMYVSMARNQPSDKKDSPGNGATPPRRSANSFHSPNNNYSNAGAMFYDECDIIYLDSQNRQVDILVDERGEIYVPLSRVQGIKRVVKKKPKYGDEVINLASGEFVVLPDVTRFHQDNDNMSQTSDKSGRVVKVNNISNDIKVERSFTEDQSQYRRSVSRNSFQQQSERNRSKSRSALNEDQDQHYKQINNTTPYHNRKFHHQSNDSESQQKGLNDNQNRNDEKYRKVFSYGAIKKTYPNKDKMHFNKNEENLHETNNYPSSSPNEDHKKVIPKDEAPRKTILKDIPMVKKLKYKSVQLPKDKFTMIEVVCPVSDTIGWVQLFDNQIEFRVEVIKKLKNIPKPELVHKPEVGMLGLAKYENAWYRARVLATNPKLRVQYIDYGNESEDPEGGLIKMESALHEFPAQAICIKLLDGAPHKLTNKPNFNVKPLVEENGITLVQVEEGMYGRDVTDKEKPVHCSTPIAEQPTATQDGVLSKIQKRLYSKVSVGTVGIIERTITLSKNSFVVSFLPSCLADDLAELSMVKTESDDSFKANIGDLVCAENEDGWNRALILNTDQNKYKIAFIDYGNISDVEEIRAMPESLIDLPQFSCICVIDNEYCDEVAKINSFNFAIVSVSDNGIRIKLNSDGKYLCETNVKAWNPLTPESGVKRKIDAAVSPQPTTTCSTVNHQTPRKLVELNLNNNDDIKLEFENNGCLFVRTKQADDILKRVNKKVNEYTPRAAMLSEKPAAGQLVAAQFENEWYRAIVKSVDNTNANIIYVDYGNDENVKTSDLKVLPPELYSEPLTLIKIKLKNFTNEPFSQKALQYLTNLAERKIILKATFINSIENGVTLTRKDGLSIIDELIKLDSVTSNTKLKIPQMLTRDINEVKADPMPKVPGPDDPKITEMDIQEIPKGQVQIKLLRLLQLEMNTITICLNKPEIFHAVHVELGALITKYANTVAPQQPYAPAMEEYVIANNEDKWYRAMCLGKQEDEYNLLFIDYGFTNFIPASKIRRMPAEFSKQPAMANFAFIDNLPESPNKAIIDCVHKLLEPNNIYDVEVIRRDDTLGGYIISVPFIRNTLKEEGLI